MATKKETPIDENLLKGFMAQDTFLMPKTTKQEPEKPDPQPKEENKRKKSKLPEYETFFQPTPFQARDGKSITIRKEFHERIGLLVRIIGKDKVGFFDYVDHVLAQHFDTYQEEMNEMFRNNTNILF